MGLFFRYPLLTLFVLALAALIVTSLLRAKRAAAGRVACPRCRALRPGHASFCSRCGHPLGGEGDRE